MKLTPVEKVIFDTMLQEANARFENFTEEDFKSTDFQKDVVQIMRKAMQTYAKIKCRKQRRICAEEADLNYDNEDCTDSGLNESGITIDKNSIINSNEPKFD